MLRSDMDIQKDIVAELKWEPGLRNDDIAVAVRDGVVTLAGFVDSYADKWKAERVASKVKGVKAIANDLEVKLPSSSERPDPEIARDATEVVTVETRRSLPPVLRKLRGDGFRIVALEQAARSQTLFDYAFRRESVLVVGHERAGLADDVLAIADDVVYAGISDAGDDDMNALPVLAAFELATGKELWRMRALDKDRSYPQELRLYASPVVHDGKLYVSTNKGVACLK